VVALLLSLPLLGKDKKPAPPATSQQNSFMMGRIVAAIEDEGGGYKDEALRRLESINADLDKLQYPAKTRWHAHYLYAKVLWEKHDRKKAAKMIALAQEDVQTLGDDEHKQTENLAQAIAAPPK